MTGSVTLLVDSNVVNVVMVVFVDLILVYCMHVLILKICSIRNVMKLERGQRVEIREMELPVVGSKFVGSRGASAVAHTAAVIFTIMVVLVSEGINGESQDRIVPAQFRSLFDPGRVGDWNISNLVVQTPEKHEKTVLADSLQSMGFPCTEEQDGTVNYFAQIWTDYDAMSVEIFGEDPRSISSRVCGRGVTSKNLKIGSWSPKDNLELNLFSPAAVVSFHNFDEEKVRHGGISYTRRFAEAFADTTHIHAACYFATMVDNCLVVAVDPQDPLRLQIETAFAEVQDFTSLKLTGETRHVGRLTKPLNRAILRNAVDIAATSLYFDKRGIHTRAFENLMVSSIGDATDANVELLDGMQNVTVIASFVIALVCLLVIAELAALLYVLVNLKRLRINSGTTVAELSHLLEESRSPSNRCREKGLVASIGVIHKHLQALPPDEVQLDTVSDWSEVL